MPGKFTFTDLDNAKSEGIDENGWLVTLSDLMMLMLTFFIMLFSITSGEDADFVGMMRKVGDALGGKSLIERKADPIEAMSSEVEKFLVDNNLVHQVHMTTDARGIVLAAEGDLFFKSAEATLKPEIVPLLKWIGRMIEKTKYKVLVEGHSDDTPISTEQFPSNWELSTARASSVIRYFIEQENMEPSRFMAAGYAEYKPAYALIPENRSKNRRVEIIIMREEL